MKKLVLVTPEDPSQCPYCLEYFDFYESQRNTGEWTRATHLKECPYCKEKIRWPKDIRKR